MTRVILDKKDLDELELVRKRITINPQVCGGKPVIRGTRITVEFILELLSSGMTPEEIAQEYGISKEDVIAAIMYAKFLVRGIEVIT